MKGLLYISLGTLIFACGKGSSSNSENFIQDSQLTLADNWFLEEPAFHLFAIFEEKKLNNLVEVVEKGTYNWNNAGDTASHYRLGNDGTSVIANIRTIQKGIDSIHFSNGMRDYTFRVFDYLEEYNSFYTNNNQDTILKFDKTNGRMNMKTGEVELSKNDSARLTRIFIIQKGKIVKSYVPNTDLLAHYSRFQYDDSNRVSTIDRVKKYQWGLDSLVEKYSWDSKNQVSQVEHIQVMINASSNSTTSETSYRYMMKFENGIPVAINYFREDGSIQVSTKFISE